MSVDDVVWRAPSPMWSRVRAGAAFRSPVLLRFAGDDFMEQLAVALDVPGGLDGLVAAAETWYDPGAGIDRAATPGPITLFQPTHGRFYLVTCSLVCRRYGHPDRRVDTTADERTSFLLRRLVPRTADTVVNPDDPATHTEHGWIDGAWQPVTATAADDGEERLPLFAATTTIDGRPRRVLAGMIPASGREAREQAATIDPDDLAASTDPLAALADTRLHGLEPVVVGLQAILTDGAGADDVPLVRESLFFSLVDLAAWLEVHLPGALTGQTPLPRPVTAEPPDLLAEDFDAERTWREAVIAARDAEPSAVFADGIGEPEPVAGISLADMVAAIGRAGVTANVPPTGTDLFTAATDALPEMAAVTTGGDGSGSIGGATAAAPIDAERAAAAVYVVRCLYERPRCRPSQRQGVSNPSRTFRLAAFHEPDAPARPVRIAMPVDTSPGGLRRFPRNVSVVLSNELRRQMARVSVDTLRDGSLGSPAGIDFGMICTLSIPIITICALILLMIIVQLLNIVFFWLPLFKICLPIPRQEGS